MSTGGEGAHRHGGAGKLILRCECGASITASRKSRLVELARIHFGEFHPDLGAGVPADLILAMAEEKEEAPAV